MPSATSIVTYIVLSLSAAVLLIRTPWQQPAHSQSFIQMPVDELLYLYLLSCIFPLLVFAAFNAYELGSVSLEFSIR